MYTEETAVEDGEGEHNLVPDPSTDHDKIGCLIDFSFDGYDSDVDPA